MIVETDLFFEDEKDPRATFKAIEKYFPNAIALSHNAVLQLSGLSRNSFRGSMALASKMKEKFEFANCLYWMPALRKYLVNQDYCFLDFEKLLDLANKEGLGKGRFIRPVSALKEFSGQVFAQVSKLETEFIFTTKNKNISPGLICVVAPAKEIFAEYRCVFVDGKYIDGCMYLLNGEREDGFCVTEAKTLAEKIANNDYFLNRGEFVIDIAHCPNEKEPYKLLEINGFETASFYSCCLDKIYSAWAKSLEVK